MSGGCHKPGICDSGAVCTGKTCVYTNLASCDGVGGRDPQRGVEEAGKAVIDGAQVACDGGSQPRTGHNLWDRKICCTSVPRITGSDDNLHQSLTNQHSIVPNWQPGGLGSKSGSDSGSPTGQHSFWCASQGRVTNVVAAAPGLGWRARCSQSRRQAAGEGARAALVAAGPPLRQNHIHVSVCDSDLLEVMAVHAPASRCVTPRWPLHFATAW